MQGFRNENKIIKQKIDYLQLQSSVSQQENLRVKPRDSDKKARADSE